MSTDTGIIYMHLLPEVMQFSGREPFVMYSDNTELTKSLKEEIKFILTQLNNLNELGMSSKEALERALQDPEFKKVASGIEEAFGTPIGTIIKPQSDFMTTSEIEKWCMGMSTPLKNSLIAKIEGERNSLSQVAAYPAAQSDDASMGVHNS